MVIVFSNPAKESEIDLSHLLITSLLDAIHGQACSPGSTDNSFRAIREMHSTEIWVHFGLCFRSGNVKFAHEFEGLVKMTHASLL